MWCGSGYSKGNYISFLTCVLGGVENVCRWQSDETKKIQTMYIYICDSVSLKAGSQYNTRKCVAL